MQNHSPRHCRKPERQGKLAHSTMLDPKPGSKAISPTSLREGRPREQPASGGTKEVYSLLVSFVPPQNRLSAFLEIFPCRGEPTPGPRLLHLRFHPQWFSRHCRSSYSAVQPPASGPGGVPPCVGGSGTGAGSQKVLAEVLHPR